MGPAWIGDMVMAQSLFMALRSRVPRARIDVLAPPGTASLLPRMSQVDNSVSMAPGHGEFGLAERRRVARALRATGYGQAIVMQRSAKAALVPWLARIPQRTGYRGEMRFGLINDIRSIDTRRHVRKVEHYVALGAATAQDPIPPVAQPRLTVDTSRQATLSERLGLDLSRPVVGFAPGAAFGGAKQWPATHYARLAAELDALGIAVWIFGGAGDRQIADQIRATAPRYSVDLCARTSLPDVIDLAALTRTFVGNDTGIMHLAAATDTHMLGLYGSTHPDYAPPLADDALSFWSQTACAPCRQRQCPLGHRACLRDLPVAEVLRACLEPAARDMPSLYRVG